MSLGFFLGLALDEIDDIRMVDVEDDHLGRATSLASRLDHARESVKALHEAERTAGGAAATQAFRGRTQRGKVGARARSPFEEHALGLCECEDGRDRVLDYD